MRLKDITGIFDTNKFYKGRYKKFEGRINYSSNHNIWYYVVDYNDKMDIRHNSLWDGIKFKKQEDCVEACQNYIDEVLKNAEIS